MKISDCISRHNSSRDQELTVCIMMGWQSVENVITLQQRRLVILVIHSDKDHAYCDRASLMSFCLKIYCENKMKSKVSCGKDRGNLTVFCNVQETFFRDEVISCNN